MKFKGRDVFLSKNGYPLVYWPGHELDKCNGTVLVHRIVAYEMYGEIPDGMEVHHIDENKLNWSHDNLEMLTSLEHSIRHYGEHIEQICGTCKLKFTHIVSKNRKYCSALCARKSREKIIWPNVQYLKDRASRIGMAALARELGISDNAINHRIKNR